MAREPVDEPEDEDRRSERDSDRETSGTWDRSRMAPTAAGHVEHSQATSEDPDQRRRDRGQREREKSRTDKKDRGGGHRRHDNESYAFGIPDRSGCLDA